MRRGLKLAGLQVAHAETLFVGIGQLLLARGGRVRILGTTSRPSIPLVIDWPRLFRIGSRCTLDLIALDDDAAQTGRLEIRPDRDGLDVDGLDVGSIADQLLDAEAVDGESTERPDDGPGRLESQREDADQEV